MLITLLSAFMVHFTTLSSVFGELFSQNSILVKTWLWRKDIPTCRAIGTQWERCVASAELSSSPCCPFTVRGPAGLWHRQLWREERVRPGPGAALRLCAPQQQRHADRSHLRVSMAAGPPWGATLQMCQYAILAVLLYSKYCDLILCYIWRFMSAILFEGITKNEENKTAQLTSNDTFNSVTNTIFYTLTEVRKRRRVVQKCCHWTVRRRDLARYWLV